MITHPPTALRAAADSLSDASVDWRLSAGCTPADALHSALRRSCGAACSFHALGMVRMLVLGSSDPGALSSALEGLTAFQLADVCRAATTVPGFP
jgi:hypothetical protein